MIKDGVLGVLKGSYAAGPEPVAAPPFASSEAAARLGCGLAGCSRRKNAPRPALTASKAPQRAWRCLKAKSGTVVCNRSAGQIDCRTAFSQMEGDRWRLKFLPKDGRKQVLPRVLLHMVEPSLPVDLSLDMSPRGKRFAHEMPHCAVLVLLYLFHGNHQRCSVPRKRAQLPRIERLSAARRVEGGAVQRQLPGQFPIAAREFAEVGYGSGKSPDKGI